ncbi:MAG: toxin-antitoxin system YwqK family antitoxin, partial [Saezia sp.]
MMRSLLSAFFSALVFVSGVSYAQSASSENAASYQIDEQATAQAPWKVGEVIASGYMRTSERRPNGERKFVGITSKGYFVVQDFYLGNGKKLTDPFVIVQQEKVDIINAYKDMPLDGVFVVWYSGDSERKMEEGHYQDGKKQGLWTTWYGNGQKAYEGYYQDGKEQGSWS